MKGGQGQDAKAWKYQTTPAEKLVFMTWFLFALLTATFESLKDVFSKRTIPHTNAYLVAWAWMALPVPVLLPIVLLQGIPPIGPGYWLALPAIVAVILSSFTLYNLAINQSALSLTVPMVAFTPLFLLVTSPLIVGEFPAPLGLVGIICIVIGSYVLNLKERHKGWLAPYRALFRERGPQLMLLVAFIWSIGANVDKIGVQNSSPFFWTLSANGVSALIMTPIMLARTSGIAQFTHNWKPLVLVGLLTAGIGMTQMTAINMALVPYVIAIKRTSVAMSVLYGYFIFREQNIRDRLSGVLIMLVGMVCITLS
jgi:drug/metabolite transporter (DMT)-like permease